MKNLISNEPIINIPIELQLKLESWVANARGREVSGVGTVRYEDQIFHVEEVYVLAGGSEVFTQIEPEHLMELVQEGVDPSRVKLWWHCHPVGNGQPGLHNWSGTDQSTILNEPLGSSPDLVKWSVSIVRTPLGWVGRVDQYVSGKTVHTPVPQIFTPGEHAEVAKILGRTRYPAQKTNQWEPKQQSRSTIGETVNDWLKRVIPRSRGSNVMDEVRRKKSAKEELLAECGIDSQTYKYISLDLFEGELPEVVAENYGLDLFTLQDVSLIGESDINDALERIQWVDDHWHQIEAGELTMEDVPGDLQRLAIDEAWFDDENIPF